MTLRLALSLLLLALASPAGAQQEGTEAKPPSKPLKQRLVCKMDAELGSKIAKRTCLTWDEWKKRDRTGADAAQQMLDRASAEGSSEGAMAAGRP